MMRYHGACLGCGCIGCNGTGKVPAEATKATKATKRRGVTCARCDSPNLYAGGLCRSCAVSIGTWGIPR